MKIAFDHQAFCLQKTGGISRYFSKLIEQLNIDGEQAELFAPFYRNQYLEGLVPKIVHGIKVDDYPRKLARVSVDLNGFLANFRIHLFKPNIIHETYFSKRIVGPISCPRVLTVFDMIGELGLDGNHLSSSQILASDKYKAVKRADKIICISHATKNDLIRVFDVPLEKIAVVHLGCDFKAAGIATELKEKINPRPYLLFVGIRHGYKNFPRLLQALASAPQLIRDFDIVTFGGGAFNVEEKSFIRSLGFRENQVLNMSGNDQSLASCYSQATALVYPSLYEGFGLPPLEAMLHNCPVICSRTSSIPEVVGEAGEYFDPTDIDSMSAAINHVVYSPQRAKSLILLGLKQAQRFTWGNCADLHRQIYATLAPSRCT